MDKMVYTQNGIHTKWYKHKMVLDKMVWTKLYRQNGTDTNGMNKIIIQSIPLPLTM